MSNFKQYLRQALNEQASISNVKHNTPSLSLGDKGGYGQDGMYKAGETKDTTASGLDVTYRENYNGTFDIWWTDEYGTPWHYNIHGNVHIWLKEHQRGF